MADDLRLKVVASSIEGKGIVKLDSDSFGALRLAEGTAVMVSYGAKTVELAARQDTVFSAATARLMKQDMADLRVEPGMEVTVSRKGAKAAEPKAKPKAKGKAKGKPSKSKRKGKGRAASLDKF